MGFGDILVMDFVDVCFFSFLFFLLVVGLISVGVVG